MPYRKAERRLAHAFGQHVHRVAGAARHAVVAVIEQQHEPIPDRARTRHRFDERRLPENELVLTFPQRGTQFTRPLLSLRGITVADDHDAHTRIRDVGEIESAEYRRRQRAAPFERARQFDAVAHGAGNFSV